MGRACPCQTCSNNRKCNNNRRKCQCNNSSPQECRKGRALNPCQPGLIHPCSSSLCKTLCKGSLRECKQPCNRVCNNLWHSNSTSNRPCNSKPFNSHRPCNSKTFNSHHPCSSRDITPCPRGPAFHHNKIWEMYKEICEPSCPTSTKKCGRYTHTKMTTFPKPAASCKYVTHVAFTRLKRERAEIVPYFQYILVD